MTRVITGCAGAVAAKAVLMYLAALVGLRLTYRRTLAQWTAIDFAAAVANGAIVGRTERWEKSKTTMTERAVVPRAGSRNEPRGGRRDALRSLNPLTGAFCPGCSTAPCSVLAMAAGYPATLSGAPDVSEQAVRVTEWPPAEGRA